jgi:hypothetical protein
MIELEVPTLSMRSVSLEPMIQTTKGVQKSRVPLEKQVQLAEPFVRAITLDSAASDPDLVEFLKGEAGTFMYYLVHLGCSFQPDQSDSFEQATLEVTLKRADGLSEPLPSTWSMFPQRDIDIVEETQSIKVTSSLQLIGSSLQLIGIELDKGANRKVQEEFVVPMGQQTPNPRWVFSETSSRRIFGFYPCTLIVRVPHGVTAQGAVGLSTMVRRMALKLFPYRAVGPDGVPFSFTLTSEGAS